MRWRKVEEETPVSEGEYLCVSKWGTDDIGKLMYNIYYYDGKRWRTDNVFDKIFTHWMPLPVVPKIRLL